MGDYLDSNWGYLSSIMDLILIEISNWFNLSKLEKKNKSRMISSYFPMKTKKEFNSINNNHMHSTQIKTTGIFHGHVKLSTILIEEKNSLEYGIGLYPIPLQLQAATWRFSLNFFKSWSRNDLWLKEDRIVVLSRVQESFSPDWDPSLVFSHASFVFPSRQQSIDTKSYTATINRKWVLSLYTLWLLISSLCLSFIELSWGLKK